MDEWLTRRKILALGPFTHSPSTRNDEKIFPKREKKLPDLGRFLILPKNPLRIFGIMTRHSIVQTAVLALGLAFTLPSAIAQDLERVDKIDVDEAEIAMQKTPEFEYSGASNKKTPTRREWLELDLKFKIEGKSTSEYISQLLFKYYIVLDDKDKTMVTAQITHVNVPIGEDIYSSVYLSPGALAKYFGKGKASERSIAGYAVEVFHKGELKGGKTDKSDGGKWWQTRAAVPEVLMPKSDTPFALLWWDRYADSQRQR